MSICCCRVILKIAIGFFVQLQHSQIHYYCSFYKLFRHDYYLRCLPSYRYDQCFPKSHSLFPSFFATTKYKTDWELLLSTTENFFLHTHSFLHSFFHLTRIKMTNVMYTTYCTIKYKYSVVLQFYDTFVRVQKLRYIKVKFKLLRQKQVSHTPGVKECLRRNCTRRFCYFVETTKQNHIQQKLRYNFYLG